MITIEITSRQVELTRFILGKFCEMHKAPGREKKAMISICQQILRKMTLSESQRKKRKHKRKLQYYEALVLLRVLQSVSLGWFNQENGNEIKSNLYTLIIEIDRRLG